MVPDIPFAASLDLVRLASAMTPIEEASVLLLVCRHGEDVSWLARLPRGASFHIVQKSGGLQRELGGAVRLPSTMMFDYPTAGAIAQFVHSQLQPVRLVEPASQT